MESYPARAGLAWKACGTERFGDQGLNSPPIWMTKSASAGHSFEARWNAKAFGDRDLSHPPVSKLCAVEQSGQLASLISWRSLVRIQPCATIYLSVWLAVQTDKSLPQYSAKDAERSVKPRPLCWRGSLPRWGTIYADIAQWSSKSLPTTRPGFDSRYPLQFAS